MKSKLDYFINIRKIPNIVFHGSAGSGKRTIVGDFINRIYHFDRSRIKNYVMFVNCAHGKGIKFIRDELKQFAKTNIQCNELNLFKSIVMYNADELTIDAQSALRRCIELFSHTTRFFIVVENKHKLLKPILSRFCEIYIPDKNKFASDESPKYCSLHTVNIERTYGLNDLKRDRRFNALMPEFEDMLSNGFDAAKHDYKWFISLSNRLYEEGITCLDIIQFFEEDLKALNAVPEGEAAPNGEAASPPMPMPMPMPNLRSHSPLQGEAAPNGEAASPPMPMPNLRSQAPSVPLDMCRVHFCFNKIKSEFRCEKMLMMYLFDYMFLRLDRSLKNVSFL